MKINNFHISEEELLILLAYIVVILGFVLVFRGCNDIHEENMTKIQQSEKSNKNE